jgi:hypothetical protein
MRSTAVISRIAAISPLPRAVRVDDPTGFV